ncbi:MAG: carbohydrate-binding domain-containing protein [Solobacterium sp.]|nr:carbohydrate-binding domain-containing protein [Solobacterium sp.]
MRVLTCIAGVSLCLLCGCAGAGQEVSADRSSRNTASVCFSEDGVTCSGRGVHYFYSSVMISSPGTYTISGKNDHARIIVNSEEEGDVHLVLENTGLSAEEGPVITVENSQRTIITVPDGTSSVLGTHGKDESGEDAVIYSVDDLRIDGSGKLTLQGTDQDPISAEDLDIQNTELCLIPGEE